MNPELTESDDQVDSFHAAAEYANLEQEPKPGAQDGFQSKQVIRRSIQSAPLREVEPDSEAAGVVVVGPEKAADLKFHVKRESLKRVIAKAWWIDAFEKSEVYGSNPFDKAPAEEFKFTTPESQVNLMNFSSELTPAQVEQVTQVLELVRGVVGPALAEAVPWILLHDSYAEKTTYDGKRRKALGSTAFDPRDNGYVSINAEALRLDPEREAQFVSKFKPDSEHAGYTAFQLVLIHEIGHRLDPLDGAYEGTLGWTRNAKGVRGIGSPSPSLADVYTAEQLDASLPVTDYGFTEPEEDFAEAFTQLMVGPDSLDPIRRDLLIKSLTHQPANRTPVSLSEPISGVTPLEVSRVTGAEISFPHVDVPQELLYTRKDLVENEF